MGFDGLASQLIMFIAVITIASGIVIAVSSSLQEATNSMTTHTDSLTLSIKTDVTIDIVSHDDNENVTYIYVKNTGKTPLKLNYTDVYLNGFRIPRNDTNRTIEVLSDTDTLNTGVWDPKEEIMIKVFQTLNAATSHKVTITTQYDVQDSEEFSI